MTLMTFLSNLLRFSVLTLIIGFSFENHSYARSLLTQMSQQLIDQKPDILYFADTDHSNFRLLSIYTELVSQINRAEPEYNCIFLELDKRIFQPALDSFMSGEKSWEDSVGTAQSDFEKQMNVIGKSALRNLISKPFLSRVRELDVKVFAVDWADKSMGASFLAEAIRDRNSWKKYLDLITNDRNSVMAENIYQILNTKDEPAQPLCRKASVFVGSKHLAEDVEEPIIGRQKYQPIASHPVLENYSQMAHVILDCNTLHPSDSKENIDQCHQAQTFREDSIIIEDLSSPKDFFEIIFIRSLSQTAENQLSTFPKISYNIMVLPEE